MDHDRDDLRERRGAKLSPSGRELLSGLERSAEASEPPSEETLARIAALPPSERKEIVTIFGETALDVADRQREDLRRSAFALSAAEAIREAQKLERAAERPVDPNMTLGDALEILGR